MSDKYPQCDFCGAEHSGPNEPGSCVMFWQRVADRYRDVLQRIATFRGEQDLPEQLRAAHQTEAAKRFYVAVEPIRIAREALAGNRE